MKAALLDSDMLTEMLKRRNSTVTAHAASYLNQHGAFALSVFSRFEIRRGYLAKHASRELARFNIFCEHSLLLPISDAVLDQACSLWVAARQGGHPQSDADLIIAATAMVHGRTLVTGNTRHFAWIVGLDLFDWRQP